MLYLFSSKPETIEKFLQVKQVAYTLIDKEKFGIFLQTYIPKEGDWGLVYDFGRIIPESLLKNLFLLNIHFSLLPKYRGAIPVEAAILGGETETGITVQRVVKEMDAGDILVTRAVQISDDWSARELQTYMDSLLPELLENLLQGNPTNWEFTPQQGEPTFCYMKQLDKENAQLKPKIYTAEELVRHIRAFNPEPLAWITVVKNGKEVIMNVLKAQLISDTQIAPGEFLFVKKRGLALGCKEGTLLITKLILAGSKELSDGDIVALKGSISLV